MAIREGPPQKQLLDKSTRLQTFISVDLTDLPVSMAFHDKLICHLAAGYSDTVFIMLSLYGIVLRE